MLSRRTAELVVQLAEDTLDPEAGFDMAAGLVTFGVDQETWQDLGLRAAALLERGNDPALGVRLIASIPDEDVQLHLREIAQRTDERVGLEAARVVRARTGAGNDPLAPHVAALLQRAADPEDTEAFRALACLPLEHYDVPPSAFDAGISAENAATRFWASIGLAKAGVTQAVLDLLDTLPDDPPPFLWGDPWSAYDAIAGAAPVSTALAIELADRYSPGLNRDQRLLIAALTGRWDVDGEELTVQPPGQPAPGRPLELDPFELDVISDLLSDYVLLAEPMELSVDEIATLGRADAGRLLSRLTERTMAAGADDVLELGNLTMRVASQFPDADIAVGPLVDRFAQDPTTMPRTQLGAVLARGNHEELAAAIVEAARSASAQTRTELAGLLRDAASADGGATPTLGSGPGAPPPSPPRAADAVRPTAAADLPKEAYPLLDAPPVVVARVPFDVTIGLSEFVQQTGTETAGAIPTRHLASGAAMLTLEAELVVDPKSLTLHGNGAQSVAHLTVSAATPFPRTTITLVAQTAPELLPERTLRLIVRAGSRVVGLASRSLVVVDTENQRASAAGPGSPTRNMLNLRPLLREKTAPDLVVGIYRSDEKADTYIWDIHPLTSTVRLADDDRRTRIPPTAGDYSGYVRRIVAAKGARPRSTYSALVGYGDMVAQAMPRALRDLIVNLVGAGETPPSVLLLTEEAFVPWELAAFVDNPLRSVAGGDSPFLGAHTAISRWPCTTDGPPPGPSVGLSADRRAVLTADYAEVKYAEALPHAYAEALQFSEAYPPTTAVEPHREAVEAILEGSVPVDLLHVALHGQFDQAAQEDGLVLLRADGAGGHERDFLTALSIGGLRNRTTTPFVFLNACQVGAGNEVLGSYAGLAAAVLRTGASGVVAPLWNIDDTVAATIADRFYSEALGTPRVPVAEVLRRIRAEYTLDAVLANPETVTATFAAYQFFGHPQFELRLPQAAHPEEDSPHG